ncbi:MAG: gamma-glutamylcyclotransferase [Gammaproteobacteria bacterium]|nr:MAG: gamma-glutamylcyclotransferase [Gammaproteobacteria bacterium]UCH38522.1 MAG: gamma-glutamylcyclotransferase [Gammaproteobacteria bacterium]
MSKNTFAENQLRHALDDDAQVWLFGYGSLIYLVDFPYLESRPASIRGWSRRFWQGSHDHRGTEENPGRVVTLIDEPGAVCGGLAYLVEAPVFRQLDHREKNGYLRVATDMTFADGAQATGLTYIATSDNEAWLGEASEYEIALHICGAEGPSGPNDEYLLELASALRKLGQHDAHVFEIESHIGQIRSAGADRR